MVSNSVLSSGVVVGICWGNLMFCKLCSSVASRDVAWAESFIHIRRRLGSAKRLGEYCASGILFRCQADGACKPGSTGAAAYSLLLMTNWAMEDAHVVRLSLGRWVVSVVVFGDSVCVRIARHAKYPWQNEGAPTREAARARMVLWI